MVARHIHPPTVLVVEDSDDTRLLMRKFLEAQGYGVVEAGDGREAVAAASRYRPDLILMDLNLPGLDGLAAAEEIRARFDYCGRPTVIALTAFDTYGMRDAALAAGCSEYLIKPLDLDRVARTIGLMLGA